MGVPMLISKHALNCCKVSANREKYKNKSHFFYFRGAAYLLKGSALPQKLQIKRLKIYK